MEIVLTYIYGIGHARAKETLESIGVNPDTRVEDLTGDELIRLHDFVQASYKVEGDSHREVAADIRRRIEISCYQGHRHRTGLPVHSQHTETSARTREGPKHTVAGKKRAK